MAVRLKDIALQADVDIGTVSHVLNDRPKAALLRAETRERIVRIAAELGYCRNELAASMARSRGKILAFICGEMGSIEYTGRVQNGVFDAASDLDYAVTLYHLSAANKDKIIQKLLGWRNAGVVFHIASFQDAGKIIEVLQQHRIPHGFVNLSNPHGIGVTTDDYQGTFAAVRHLRESACRKLALYTHAKAEAKDACEYLSCREEGFRAGMRAFYPDVEPVFFHDDESGTVHEQRQRLQAFLTTVKLEHFDGIICPSDILAIKLLQMCPACNMKVPDDFLLVGYGDLGMASLTVPTLSTVAQNFEEMGGTTARLVIDVIEKKRSAVAPANILLPAILVNRESSQITRERVQS